jgi:hypothetical protein
LLIGLTDQVHGGDVWVRQLGSGARLSDKALDHIGVAYQVGAKHFDGHGAVHALLHGAVDGTGGTMTADRLDLKLSHEQSPQHRLFLAGYRYYCESIDGTEPNAVTIPLAAVGAFRHKIGFTTPCTILHEQPCGVLRPTCI